jgi:hypothetical protein
MTYEECMEQVRSDTARIEAAQRESARMQAAIDTFNTEFQAIWTIYCAELSTLIYRGMFDPSFCKPAGDA